MSSFTVSQIDSYILLGLTAIASALCYLSYHSITSKFNVKQPTSNLHSTSTTRIDRSSWNFSTTQVQLGGGPSVKPNSSRQASMPNKIGEYIVLNSVTVATNLTIKNNWRPPRLPTLKSYHPLEVCLTPQVEGKIRLLSRQESSHILVYVNSSPLTEVTTDDLRDLISHGKMTSDNLLNTFMNIITSQTEINFLSTHFLTKLRQEKSWDRLSHWFASSTRPVQPHRPSLQSPVIMIPCHVHGNHWVAVTRRIINRKIHFFYADDMNNTTTESIIKEQLRSFTNNEFYPPDATWVRCHNTTYHPHSNECGPRTLLALTIMGLHPNPGENMLLPYMSGNLAQLSRYWVAATILSGTPLIPAMNEVNLPYNRHLTAHSAPYCPISWADSTDIERNPSFDSNPALQQKTTLSQETSRRTPNGRCSTIPDIEITDRHRCQNSQLQNGNRKKHGRWKQTTRHKQPKQTTIRKFIVTQPRLFDYGFLKPQAEVNEEDPDTWGHIMESVDNKKILRVLLQNPNGIQPHISHSDFLFGLHMCESVGVGVLCLSETNLNWQAAQLSSTKKCFRKTWTHSSIQPSQGEEAFDSTYKPGGTLTAVMDNWTSRVEEKGVDPYGLGRWSYIALRGSRNTKVYIVTAYRVCDNKDSGPKTAYRQQFRKLSKEFRKQSILKSPDPHKQCILDLQAWLEMVVKQGHQIILSLDSNEDISDTPLSFIPLTYREHQHATHPTHNGSLATLMTTCGLVDPLAYHHSMRPFPATYSRGRSRLDYILVSSSILPMVRRSGILPYQAMFHSDHRSCFIDIDSHLLFGTSTTDMVPPCRRQLQLFDPRIVEQYNVILKNQLTYHRISEKVKIFQKKIERNLWSKQDQEEYEKVDKIITESMLFAEKKSSKKYTNTFAWSPTLVQTVQAERFWKLHLKRNKGGQVHNSTLSRTMVAAGLQNIPDYPTINTIVCALREAKQHRKQSQQHHLTLREMYLERLATSVVLKASPQLEDPKHEKRLTSRIKEAVKRIQKKERRRIMYKSIGSTLAQNNENRGGLARIDVPAPSVPQEEQIDPKTWQGPWRAVTDPDEMGFYICETNTKQYNQAESTPFASGYIVDSLGDVLTSKAADRLLSGHVELDMGKVPLQETKNILTFLAKPYPQLTSPCSGRISPERFISNYKIVKENSSSSYSGRHVGHYKAVLENPFLVDIHASMMSIPYQVGFSPRRWHQVVDVMLEKEPGNPKQHRLRIVALLESDYNQSQRILLARRLTHHMEDANLMHDMQYGSRPSRMCISPVLNKVLSFDIVRQTKVNGAFIENDAIGCYDRLVNDLVFLELRHLGLPITVLQSIQASWDNACHHIKTKYGYSGCTYQNSLVKRLFGPGQGSTPGPSLWSILFCLIAKNLPGDILTMFFKAVNNSLQIKHAGDAFVDDAQLGCTSELPKGHHGPQSMQVQEVLRGIKYMAQSWERLLFTTGGAINLQKSSWNLLTWQWNRGIAKLSTNIQSPAELKLTAGYDPTQVVVPRISPYDGFRTLGVYISPSGSVTLAISKLKQISVEYATAVTGSRLSRSAALWSYLLYLIPKLTYSTPALTLTEPESHTIQSPSVVALLPKLNMNRNTNRHIVFGPVTLGGLEIPTVYSTQSYGQLAYFTGHINLGDKTGKLLLISLTYLQLLSGSRHPILQQPYKHYSLWIEQTWLTSFWVFLSKVRYKVIISNQWVPTIQRRNDHSLMDHFQSLGYSATQLSTLNRCRLYLQVLFLSDLTSADGTVIIPACKQGQRLVDRISNLNWPIQERPPQAAWTLWKQALAHFENNDRLLIPLRAWTGQSHQRWRWFTEVPTQHLYSTADNGEWFRVLPSTLHSTSRTTRMSARASYDITQRIPAPNLPRELLPTTLTPGRLRALFTSSSGPALIPDGSNPKLSHTAFESTLFSSPREEQLLAVEENLDDVDTIYIATSYHQEQETFAYGWSIFTTKECVSDAGRITNRHHIDSSTANLVGLLAALSLLQSLTRPVGTIVIRLPTRSLSKTLQDSSPVGVNHMTRQDFDLFQSVRLTIQLLQQSSAVTLYVAEEVPQEISSQILERAHDSAFLQASTCNSNPTEFTTVNGVTSACVARVERGGIPIAGNFRSLVRQDLYYEDLKATIIKAEKWSDHAFHRVAWDAYSKAFQKLSRPRQISYVKLSHRLWQTNARNSRFYGSSAICPCCTASEETFAHVLTCPFPAIVDARQDLLATYRTTLQDCGTPDILIEAVLHGITSWTQIEQRTIHRHAPPNLQDSSTTLIAYKEQTKPIGWEAFLRGRVVLSWGKAYLTFFPDATDQEVEGWLSDLIRTNLDFSLSLWKLRNGVVHGFDQEASRVKEKHKLQQQVTNAFLAYQTDPFIISRNHSHLFDSRSLHQRLQQDTDSMRCWLADVAEARETQRVTLQRAAIAARQFFCPRQPKNQSVPDPSLSDFLSETSGGSTRTYDSLQDDDSISTATLASSLVESVTVTSRQRDPPERLRCL